MIWLLLKTKNKKTIGDQGGRVEGHEALFPLQTHQKYIYMWNNSYRKPSESCHKISYTTKAIRKIPT